MSLLIAACVVFFAYFVRGISGFGSALIAVPLLVHLFPLTLVVPVVAALDLVAALLLTGVGQRAGDVVWREVAWLMPGTLVGIGLGLWVLVSVDERILLSVLGVVVVAFGLRHLLRRQAVGTIRRAWAVPTGIVGGAVGAALGTGGPPYVVYLGHRLHQRQALRATLSAVFLVDGSVRVLGFLATGLLLQAATPGLLLGGGAVMAAGLFVGHRVHLGLSDRQVAVAVAVLLLISGLSLLLRALS